MPMPDVLFDVPYTPTPVPVEFVASPITPRPAVLNVVPLTPVASPEVALF